MTCNGDMCIVDTSIAVPYLVKIVIRLIDSRRFEISYAAFMFLELVYVPSHDLRINTYNLSD